MDQFRADLHVHSRFSRATSKALTARHLAAWARVKGIALVGTGDFTHPGWLAELEEQLVPDETGLYKLASEQGISREIPWLGGYMPQGRTRFILQGEVSSIYKRGGAVRKVHNLVFMPSFAAARSLNARLEKIGNISSDGRPILGLDSRDLLEMVLETDPRAFLVPAHIWTPWFSLFGSKSGFNSVEECYGDLASEIFAMETGLSSDPEMNWLWSHLDRYRLISNSDAHSGDKLGREANIFSGGLSYATVLRSLKGEGLGQRFLGTLEFYPEEGKYHMDGHRKCGHGMDPRQTRERGGLCPVCGKPVTVGVLSRVLELSDRAEPLKPEGQPGFVSLVPLGEILAELLGCGVNTKKVRTAYAKAVTRLGPELDILQEVNPAEARAVSSLLPEALTRLRQGKVFRDPGFDGQYGRISLFSEAEKRELRSGKLLVDLGGARRRAETARTGLASPMLPSPTLPTTAEAGPDGPTTLLAPFAEPSPGAECGCPTYNQEQLKAIGAGPGPVLVLAGPGTGKTQTLLGRVSALLDSGVSPRRILACTFTRKAAEELRRRLSSGRPEGEALPQADTLHALAFSVWSEAYAESPIVMAEEAAFGVFRQALGELPAPQARELWRRQALARERMERPQELIEAVHPYVKLKESWNLVDYTDLLEFWLEQLEAGIYVTPYTHLLVDEVQDLTPLQLAVIKALAGAEGQGLFAIGDPNQSIYGFRGAGGPGGGVAEHMQATWPDLETIRLTANYRSAPELLAATGPLFPEAALTPQRDTVGEIQLFAAPSHMQEAAWIAERIKGLLGVTSHSLQDAHETHGEAWAPGDLAVLVRFKALIAPIRRSLERLGIPCSAPEEQAFWVEPRVAALLDAAARFVGMAGTAAPDLLDRPERAEKADKTDQGDQAAQPLEVPDKVLVKGPMGLAAYLQDIPPFDRLFWKSRAYREFSQAFAEQGGWVGLLNWINLQSAMEQVSARAEKVQVMTMHAAKGLEFRGVFLAALEDGILPFAGAAFLAGKAGEGENQIDVDEERRLFYVGATRAMERLYLSHAARRELYGREFRLRPTRFLAELPQDLLRRSAMVQRTRRQEEQISLM